MVDVAVKSEAAWACRSQGRHLADIVLHVHVNNTVKDEGEVSELDKEETHW